MRRSQGHGVNCCACPCERRNWTSHGSVSVHQSEQSPDRWHVHRLLAYPPKGQPAPIEAIIPPCNHAQIKKSKRRYRHIEARNQRVQQMKKSGRKKWKQQSGYHRRSLAETAMAHFKRIIGPQLQAWEWKWQKVEVKIGCAILNRMTHVGMPQSYKIET